MKIAETNAFENFIMKDFLRFFHSNGRGETASSVCMGKCEENKSNFHLSWQCKLVSWFSHKIFLQFSNTEESTIKSKDEQWKFKEWTKEKRAQQDIKAECVKKPKPSEKLYRKSEKIIYYSIWKTNLPRRETTINHEISNLAHYTIKPKKKLKGSNLSRWNLSTILN